MANYSIREMAGRLIAIRSACDTSRNQFVCDALTKFADELKAIDAEFNTVRQTLIDAAGIIDVTKSEWEREGAWSEWDAGVRDRITQAILLLGTPALSSQPWGSEK